jgi:uncharacterized membrane protein YhaH (DUF805 family)
MTFGQAISSCYSKYATFEGRASRSEYWFFQLYHCLLLFAGIVLGLGGVGAFVLGAATLVNLLPALSVLVRRLHDTDRSGWWYWFMLVPLIGPILLIVWLCTRGSWGENRFGPDPLGGEVPPGYARPTSGDMAEQLSRLAKLRDAGTISEEEFQRLKTKLI